MPSMMRNRGTSLSLTLPEAWDCIVCGKHFCKKKSLGGHMNRHPDRPWRGIYPPPTGESSTRDTIAFPSLPINLTLIAMSFPYQEKLLGTLKGLLK